MVIGVDLKPYEVSVQFLAGDGGRAAAHERIEDERAFARAVLHEIADNGQRLDRRMPVQPLIFRVDRQIVHGLCLIVREGLAVSAAAEVQAVFFVGEILVAEKRGCVRLAPDDHIHFALALLNEKIYVLRDLRAVAPNVNVRHFHNVPHGFEIHVVDTCGQFVLGKLVVHRLDTSGKFAMPARFRRFNEVRRIGHDQVGLNTVFEHFLDTEQAVHIVNLIDFQHCFPYMDIALSHIMNSSYTNSSSLSQ